MHRGWNTQPGRSVLAVLVIATLAPASGAVAGSAPRELNAAPFGACGQWNEWFPNGPSFSRYSHTMIYDPVGDRLLVFGGFDDMQSYSPEVWALNLGGTPTWATLATSGTPPPGLVSPSAVYDATRNRMIIYGGFDSGIVEQAGVWALALGGTPTWSEITPLGPSPGARVEHTAIYDGTRDRMVVFGGSDAAGTYVANDVWALALAPGGGWTQLSTSGTAPAPRSLAAAIYDAPRDRMLVFGGIVSTVPEDALTNDVWSLSFSGGDAWTELSPSGGTPPVPRADAVAIFDAPRDRMVVFGGQFDPGDWWWRGTNDVWTLGLTGGTSWSQESPGGWVVPANHSHAAVYDPVRQRMHVVGGYGAAGDESWSYTLDAAPAWTPIQAQGLQPRPRAAHTMVVDAPRQRVVLFGGSTSGATSGDVWTHPLTGPGDWTRLYPTGGHPNRYSHSAIYDPAGERMIVFGGANEIYVNDYLLEGDVWALSLAGSPAWTQLTPSGPKPARRKAAPGMFDSVRGRMLVWSGYDSTSTPLLDLWALDLAGGTSWSKINAGGDSPVLWAGSAAIYDALHDRVVVVGPPDFQEPLDVWSLPLAGGGDWTLISPGGAPALGPGIQAVFDGLAERLLVFEGQQTHALSLDAAPEWSAVASVGAPPANRFNHATAFDPATNRLLVMGGSVAAYNGEGDDLWALEFSPNLRSLRAIASPPAGGSVSVSPSGVCFAPGTEITLTATPNPGYVFTGWTGDATGMTNPLAVKLDVDKTIHGTFDLDPSQCDTCNTWGPVNAVNGLLPMRANPAIVRDAVAHRLLAFGQDQSGSVAEVWQLPLAGSTQWTRLTTSGTGPYALSQTRAVYDPARHRVILYGGQQSFSQAQPGVIHGDVWVLSLAGTPAWSLLVPQAAGPAPLWKPTLTYDPVRDRLLLFGGSVVPASTDPANYRDDVHELPLAGTPAWSLVTPSTSLRPGKRHSAAAIFDPLRDRLIVFGGLGASDLWAMSLSGPPTWSPIATFGTTYPYPVSTSAMYDSLRDRMVVFGGGATFGGRTAGIAALSLKYDAAWVSLSPGGVTPPGMAQHWAVYDPVSDRMIVAGGSSVTAQGQYFDNQTVHALRFSRGAWLDLYSASPGLGSLTRTPDEDRFAPGALVTVTAVPASGYVLQSWIGDAGGLENPLTLTLETSQVIGALFRSTVSVDPSALRTGIESVTPNPGAWARVRFTLARETAARLSVVDVAGREVEVLARGTHPAGRYVVTFGGASGRPKPPGVYFLRLVTQEGVEQRRFVIAR